MNIEVGDEFVINWKSINKLYPDLKKCLYPDKRFIVIDKTKSGLSVYFEDNRTNNNCKCSYCSKPKDNNRKSIGIVSITLTRKKQAIERDRKLKKIGIR